MKRNWDLIREILIRVEDLSSVKEVVRPNEFEEYDKDEVSYHMYLLEQASLVEGSIQKNHSTELDVYFSI